MSMKAEVIGAMWLYGQEYSQGRLSAVDFYASLLPDRKRTVGEMVAQIGRAHANAALEKAASHIEAHRVIEGERDAIREAVETVRDQFAAAVLALCEEGSP